MIQAEGIFAGRGAVTAAPIIGKDFNWSGGDGTYVVLDDGDGNWRIKFLSSGTFTPLKDMVIDVFLVGGGGRGGSPASSIIQGGGGGYTKTVESVVLTTGIAYDLVIGAGSTSGSTQGGSTSAFGNSAAGGYDGGNSGHSGMGGSGGAGLRLLGSPTATFYTGGTDGGNGSGSYGGTGQGTSTRAFGETDGELFSSGGAAAWYNAAKLEDGVPNTGDGGDCDWTTSLTATSGVSGIVIIRKHKEVA